MDGFLIAVLLVSALAMGGRDQWLVAQWADALAWVAPDKLHLYPMPPADIPLIDAIKAWGHP